MSSINKNGRDRPHLHPPPPYPPHINGKACQGRGETTLHSVCQRGGSPRVPEEMAGKGCEGGIRGCLRPQVTGCETTERCGLQTGSRRLRRYRRLRFC